MLLRDFLIVNVMKLDALPISIGYRKKRILYTYPRFHSDTEEAAVLIFGQLNGKGYIPPGLGQHWGLRPTGG